MSRYLPINLYIRQALLYPLRSPFLPPVGKVEKDYSYAAGKLAGSLVSGGPPVIFKTLQTYSIRTGDDGNIQAGLAYPVPRYVDNGDNTITDNGTGLMWVKDPSQLGGSWGTPGTPDYMVWNDEIDLCLGLDHAGHQDWRMPNLRELISLPDYERIGNVIDTNIWPNFPPSIIDTSTLLRANITRHFYSAFSTGILGTRTNTSIGYPRPVRTT